MLTADRLREVLDYDPDTGFFTWRVSNGRRAIKGHEAGFIHAKGYRRIKIDGRLYEAHRLAFLYVTGEWPEHGVDHRDMDPSNNAWGNLRPATPSQNAANSIRAGRDLPKGVTHVRGGYQAKISARGEAIYLGTYATPSAAHGVYAAAARDLHGEFARVA